MLDEYNDTTDALEQRITALIPTHPEILVLTTPWMLFAIAEFKCDDLSPSFAQASSALCAAQQKAKAAAS